MLVARDNRSFFPEWGSAAGAGLTWNFNDRWMAFVVAVASGPPYVEPGSTALLRPGGQSYVPRKNLNPTNCRSRRRADSMIVLLRPYWRLSPLSRLFQRR